MTNHETLMRRAMHMAATARTHARPNPWVGAVVVCADGSVTKVPHSHLADHMLKLLR